MSPCEHLGNIIICTPTLDRQWVSAGECPDCKTWTRFINFLYEWYGVDSTCLRCGRTWSDGEWMRLEFARFARRDRIASAKRAWRRNRGRLAREPYCVQCDGRHNPYLSSHPGPEEGVYRDGVRVGALPDD